MTPEICFLCNSKLTSLKYYYNCSKCSLSYWRDNYTNIPFNIANIHIKKDFIQFDFKNNSYEVRLNYDPKPICLNNIPNSLNELINKLSLIKTFQ